MGDSKEDDVKYQTMWGAKVMLPCDMPDDILEDSIKTSKQLLTEVLQADRNEGLQKQGPEIVETLKKQFDAKWGQNWHVVCGKSFGCYATHQSSKFVYFYVGDVAFMFYQT
jgi:dynein light chain LC8-type